jgi:hypothetical protein
MNAEVLVPVLIGVLVLALVFLVAREVVCWYWKINRAVELLQSIDARLLAIEQAIRQGNLSRLKP